MDKAKLGKTHTRPPASGGAMNRRNGTGSIAPGRGPSPGVRTPANKR